MKKYDYYEAMRKFVNTAIRKSDPQDFDNREDYEDYLFDQLYDGDGIIGYADTWFDLPQKAAVAVTQNRDLLYKALEFFGYSREDVKHGYSWCDLLIRQYLLSDIIHDAVNELTTGYPEIFEQGEEYDY